MRLGLVIALLAVGAACGGEAPTLSGGWRGGFTVEGRYLACAGAPMVGELRFVRDPRLPGEQYSGERRICGSAQTDLWARVNGEDFVFTFGGDGVAVVGRIRGDELNGLASGLGAGADFHAARIAPRVAR